MNRIYLVTTHQFKDKAMITEETAICTFSGYTIEINDFLCCRPEQIQYRFPKSKKIRIKKKWRKQLRNFKTVEKHYTYKVDNRIIVSNKIYNKLKDKVNERVNRTIVGKT